MVIMGVKKLFSVSARESNCWAGYSEVFVVAENTRQARRIGVNALEHKGIIDRKHILDTDIYEAENEVYA